MSLTHIIFVVFGQITQQVFVAMEWYRDACKRTNVEALTCADVEKSLGAARQEQIELSEKLKVADQARSSAEAGLKTAERQAEDQHQKLHLTKIDLATQKQLVINLKVELQKAKEKARLAREAVEVEKKASYKLGVKETQVRLAKELLEVCRDYCDMTWDKAPTAARVLIDSVLRLPEKVYYHLEIRKIPTASSPPTPTLESSEQPLAILDALPLPEISKGFSQVGDQGQGAEGEKGKGKDKVKKSFAKAKDATKATEAKAETQEVDPKAKDAPTSQPSQKEDPPAKA